jgi:hypothetical protein
VSDAQRSRAVSMMSAVRTVRRSLGRSWPDHLLLLIGVICCGAGGWRIAGRIETTTR